MRTMATPRRYKSGPKKGQFMPKRRANRTRASTRLAPRKRYSKYKKAINIKNAGVAYATLYVVSETVFGTDPIGFIMGKKYGNPTKGYGNYQPGNALSLQELFGIGQTSTNPKPPLEQMKENLTSNWWKGVAGLASIKVAEVALQRLGISRNFNKAVRSIGMGNLVKM